MTFYYGPKIDSTAYHDQMHDLYFGGEGRPPVATRDLPRQELDLTIDHKLGRDFPVHLREALWQANRRIRRRQLLVLFLALVRKALGASEPVENALYRMVIRQYGRILSLAELSAMVDVPVATLEALPH
jgi:hypothetical protein